MEQIDVDNSKRRLKEVMKEKGITPKDILNNTDITSMNAVYKWLNMKNHSLPSLDTYIQLSALLEVSLDELLMHVNT